MVNVLFKSVFIISIGVVTYRSSVSTLIIRWVIGESLKIGFRSEAPSTRKMEISEGRTSPTVLESAVHDWIRGFIFQAMFAATGATIVSSAVAERVKLSSFMIFAVVFVALAYPIAGSWHWGGGWLANMDFKDFAGSTVVHAFGGFGSRMRSCSWA